MRPDATTTSTPPDDLLRDLVVRARAGDAEAFGELYDATCPLVHGMVSRMLPDGPTAERVTESAYLRAFTDLAAARRPGQTGVLSWLLDLAHTEALVEVRREDHTGRGARVLSALAAHEAGDPAPTGVWAAMARLTGSQRRSLHLAYFGGLQHHEVDTTLGLPAGAASARLGDGLHALRDHLEELGLLASVSA